MTEESKSHVIVIGAGASMFNSAGVVSSLLRGTPILVVDVENDRMLDAIKCLETRGVDAQAIINASRRKPERTSHHLRMFIDELNRKEAIAAGPLTEKDLYPALKPIPPRPPGSNHYGSKKRKGK